MKNSVLDKSVLDRYRDNILAGAAVYGSTYPHLQEYYRGRLDAIKDITDLLDGSLTITKEGNLVKGGGI